MSGVRTQKHGKRVFVTFSCCQSNHRFVQGGRFRNDIHSVQFQKRESGLQCRPFVPIVECMIFRKMKSVCRCNIKKIRLALVEIGVLGLSQSRFQQARIA